MTRVRTENLGNALAFVLHRPHPAIQGLTRQLRVIGLELREAWPDLPAEAISADFIFYDADTGHDEQFPWAPGASPMPMIALIGSEAPGRLNWALTMGAHAQLLKPVSDKGVYAALLVARANYDRARASDALIADLEDRLSARQTVVQAVMIFVLRGKSEAEAYELLRQTAMAWRVTIEIAAARLVANHRAKTPGKEDRK
ncbi:ANTAR domain-containing response regulator [Rhodobacter sp. 24-YEA-8]|uniref:ANTAR domain-containing response regulator n=1 Tax=Rhodobacter sp. 24-YEA-8 TaxID=1884310 RepID=UPI00089469B0|nr:ANTAR domain-containing protein [Rhodobacter sp. 24-YEA-8]SED13547.1 Two-component response regulator, AmiR/NasT family, consists of REC and RNA-binding antiterminator (ANTAR) domains [Rhodobacter sp. 24-YEA-8]